MTTLSRRGLLATTGAVSLAGVLAACADTGADGKAVASSSASDADYDKAINSGPVAADDVVAASTWAAAVKQAGKLVTGGTKTSEVFSWEDSKTKKISGVDAAIARRWPATSSAVTMPAPSWRFSRIGTCWVGAIFHEVKGSVSGTPPREVP